MLGANMADVAALSFLHCQRYQLKVIDRRLIGRQILRHDPDISKQSAGHAPTSPCQCGNHVSLGCHRLPLERDFECGACVVGELAQHKASSPPTHE
jgi:hypothetical protein